MLIVTERVSTAHLPAERVSAEHVTADRGPAEPRPLRPARLRVVSDQPSGTRALPRTLAEQLPVPTLHRGIVDYANFDHAASTPALETVKQAVDTALRTYSSVHRGNGYASKVTSRWYEEARAEVAAFVGARVDDLVVFTRGSTDSLNLLARTLPRGTRVFVFESEHHAALLPWDARRTVRLPVPGSQQDALDLLEDALASAPDGPKLVVVAGASNVTGEVWPVATVARLAHRYGARIALDAAQLAPHRQVDIQALDVDYVVLSGHKVYAPFGAGVLAGRADWLEAADPYLRGGGATARVTGTQVEWNAGAARHEAGSPNVIGAIALAAACATLTEHRDSVEAHEEALAARLRNGLAEIDGVHIYSIFGEEHDRVGVVAFTVPRLPSSLVSAALSAEYGIGVRDGKFCAHLLVDTLLDGTGRLTAQTTAVRASVGLANTPEHVDRLVDAIRTLATTGPGTDYELTADGWLPTVETRDLELPRPW